MILAKEFSKMLLEKKKLQFACGWQGWSTLDPPRNRQGSLSICDMAFCHGLAIFTSLSVNLSARPSTAQAMLGIGRNMASRKMASMRIY